MADGNYWMIGADGRTYGPVDHATILRWISERRIAHTTQLSTSAEGPWRDGSSFAEFADVLGVPAAAPAVPSQPPAPPSWPAPPGSGTGQPAAWPPDNLQAVGLIAGIFNILTGVCVLIFGCWCCVLGIPPIIIGAMQCADYAGAARMAPARYLDRAQTWGILNVIMIIFGNVGSVVCGILQLCWIGEARAKYLK